MSNKYPPLPEPLYERGDAPSMGMVSTDCYSADQMHAYAEAAREGWLSPEDAKRLRGADKWETFARAAGQVPPKRQDDAPLDFDGDFEEDLWDERDE